MPEPNKDVVEVGKYNEAIEKINSEKIQKEKAEAELKELKEFKEKVETDKIAAEKKAEEDQKLTWEKEKEDLMKTNEEMKKKLEERDPGKPNPKGVVPTGQPAGAEGTPPETTREDLKKELDERFPGPEKDARKFATRFARYGYYHNPQNKAYSHEQMGELLSLHMGAQRANPDIINKDAAEAATDLVIRHRGE